MQPGKVILTANQHAHCLALNDTPAVPHGGVGMHLAASCYLTRESLSVVIPLCHLTNRFAPYGEMRQARVQTLEPKQWMEEVNI